MYFASKPFLNCRRKTKIDISKHFSCTLNLNIFSIAGGKTLQITSVFVQLQMFLSNCKLQVFLSNCKCFCPIADCQCFFVQLQMNKTYQRKKKSASYVQLCKKIGTIFFTRVSAPLSHILTHHSVPKEEIYTDQLKHKVLLRSQGLFKSYHKVTPRS